MATPTASGFYHKGNEKLLKGEIDLVNDDIRILFLSDAHVIDLTDEFVSEVVANESSGSTRQALAGEAITSTTNVAKFDANDIALTSETFDFEHIVMYKYNVADSAADLIAYWTFTPQSASAQDININWNAGGIITDTAQTT